MKYYRWNQVAMAVLGALLLFFGTRALINIIQKEHEPEEPGVEVAGKEETKKGEEKPAGADLAALLAAGDAAHGEQAAKKCAICHTFDQGGATLIGPNLYGVLGRKVASAEGYEYSDALKAKDGTWDYAMVDHMIENPNAFAPGTKMVFPGLPDAKERADVILFLRSKSDSPPPLPEVAAAPAEETPAAETPAAEAPAAGESEVIALLATADPAKGETDAALCKVCHTFDKGGAVLVGPNLYDIVGKDIASQEGVTYTPGLTAKDGDWTYEALDEWLTSPQAFAQGTTMAFPGVPDAKKRADIIAFLRSNSDNPAPLPTAGEEAPAAEPAPPAETPAAEPEAPAEPEAAAPEEAPAAEPETPAKPEAAAPEEAPAAEPEALAEPEPSAEPEAAPVAEAPPAAEEEPAPSEPSMGEPPSPSQPVQADQEIEETPVAEAPAEEAPAEETPASAGEPPSPSQPQPVYPNGPPEGVQ